jgi:hypothetical protein
MRSHESPNQYSFLNKVRLVMKGRRAPKGATRRHASIPAQRALSPDIVRSPFDTCTVT